MQRIRADVARRRAAAGRVAAATEPAPADAGSSAAALSLDAIALPRFPESSGSIVRKDRYVLAEFLAYHDEDFVRNAYRGILRREPDADGFASFLEALRQGRMAKVEVLGRMRFSPEGRTVGVRVRALPIAFALRSARRVPVLGRMLGIVQYLFRLPDIARNHEHLEATFFQRQLELHRQINTAEAKIERGITQVQRSLQDVDAATRANLDGVRAEMARKADAAQVAAELAQTVKQAELGAVDQRVSDLAASAAPRREVEMRFLSLERALEFKADSENLTRLTNRIIEQLERRPEKAELDALVAEFSAARREYMATTAALAASKADQAYVETITARIAELQTAKTDASEFEGVVAELREQFLASGRILREQERRLTALIEEARRKYRESVIGAEPAVLVEESDHLFDAFYAAFENRFRGTPEDIRQRVTVYLPAIQESRAGTPEAPVLDIGCGRGEWLEVLKESGLVAQGIDLNRVTVSQCRERGLAVVEGDAIEYLRGVAEGSLGAVTALHVIEHLPFRRLIMLLDEVLHALRPGGLAIFETPNPENLMVGACNFYYDPTHQRPLPPEPTRFVAESARICGRVDPAPAPGIRESAVGRRRAGSTRAD